MDKIAIIYEYLQNHKKIEILNVIIEYNRKIYAMGNTLPQPLYDLKVDGDKVFTSSRIGELQSFEITTMTFAEVEVTSRGGVQFTMNMDGKAQISIMFLMNDKDALDEIAFNINCIAQLKLFAPNNSDHAVQSSKESHERDLDLHAAKCVTDMFQQLECEQAFTKDRNSALEANHAKNCETLSKLIQEIDVLMRSLEFRKDPERMLQYRDIGSLKKLVSSRLEEMIDMDMVPYYQMVHNKSVC